MRRAVCRRQLSFLFLDSVECITTITAEYAVETVNFPYTRRCYNGECVIYGLQSHTRFPNPEIQDWGISILGITVIPAVSRDPGIRDSPILDWRRRAGRPRRTWLRTIELDLRPHNLGLNTAWIRAQDLSTWRQFDTWRRAHWWARYSMMMIVFHQALVPRGEMTCIIFPSLLFLVPMLTCLFCNRKLLLRIDCG